MSTENASTKVVTGLVRFSYANLFEPKAVEGSEEKKYSMSIIIPKSDKATLKKINAAIEAAKTAGATKLGKIGPKFKLPLRDGDEEKPDDEAYENSYFIGCTSKTKPGVVDKNKDKITNEEDIKSGDYGYVSINFYPFNTNGNKGIAAGLNNVMKVKDGEALSGRTTAEEDFADVTVDDEDDDML
jgi:hypothetical protein